MQDPLKTVFDLAFIAAFVIVAITAASSFDKLSFLHGKPLRFRVAITVWGVATLWVIYGLGVYIF